VAERLDIKHIVYQNLIPHLKDSAILTSNTSGIPLEDLISVFSDDVKTRFMITHFFNPPRYMRLLELVRGPETSDEVYTLMLILVKMFWARELSCEGYSNSSPTAIGTLE
jgi:3-hydroxyacyl-CoA dehydrogenase